MVSGIAFASGALYRPRPEAGTHSFAESELNVFTSFRKAEKRRDRADSVGQFLRHQQLDPDRRDGGAITQTAHH
jgi:hypothetical protein